MQRVAQRNAIVIGMPRSGTSLAASVFARKGYFVADDEASELDPGDDHNPFGYWEATRLVERNVAILAAAGFPHHNTWLYEAISDEQARRIAELEPAEEDRQLVAGYNQSQPWMWKDPRFCYTLSYWWKLMDPAQTGVLLIRREPEAIYNSFLRRSWRKGSEADRRDVFSRVDHHIAAAERAIQEGRIPHLAVRYQDYLEKPGMVAERVGTLFGMQLSVADLNVRAELNHSSAKGRIGASFYRLKKHLPGKRILKRVIPSRLITLLWPERKYAPPQQPSGGQER